MDATFRLQQGGAVREEVGMGNAVVLQDDALLHLLIKPGDRAAHPEAAALVSIGVEALDLAGPVDFMLDQRAGGSHLLGFAGALGVGARRRPKTCLWGPRTGWRRSPCRECGWGARLLRRWGIHQLIKKERHYFCASTGGTSERFALV
jgi:hypothetical protein